MCSDERQKQKDTREGKNDRFVMGPRPAAGCFVITAVPFGAHTLTNDLSISALWVPKSFRGPHGVNESHLLMGVWGTNELKVFAEQFDVNVDSSSNSTSAISFSISPASSADQMDMDVRENGSLEVSVPPCAAACCDMTRPRSLAT
jgi:hypothetical protein